MSFRERFSGKISIVTKTGGLHSHNISKPPSKITKKPKLNPLRGPHSANARLMAPEQSVLTTDVKPLLSHRPTMSHRPTVSDLGFFSTNNSLPPSKPPSENSILLPSVNQSNHHLTSNPEPPSPQYRASKEPRDLNLNETESRRAVDYQPYTLSDYKRLQPKNGYFELGKLQPNLETDEYKQKKAKYDRARQFGQMYTNLNKNLPKGPTKPKPKPKGKSKREIALEFASRLPKPCPPPKPAVKRANSAVDDGSELKELERIHNQDRMNVEVIEKKYGLVS
ncbi:hypothetical protein P9112_011196 [Eukaryota sp. TZLM1-RC]